MSYVQASQDPTRNRTSFALAFALHAGAITALILMPSAIQKYVPKEILTAITITPEKTFVPDIVPPEQVDTKALPDIFSPPIKDPIPRANPDVKTTPFVEADTSIRDGAGTTVISEPIIDIKPPHVPVFIAPRLDTRFANGFQPDYPQRLIREEMSGSVRVRILVGADGRVKLTCSPEM